MLDTLKDLFASLQPASEHTSPAAAEHGLQLATAVLLVEVMRAEPNVDAAERAAVIDALREHFALAEDETGRLVELAERTSRQAVDLFGFTSKIDTAFDMPQKLRMVEQLWAVAYADGRLGAHEQHMIWRVADLLHIPHGAYVNAKMRAQSAAGPG